MLFELVKIITVVGLALNLMVTIFLLSRVDLGKTQKLGQIIIVWLVPFLGPIGLWLFNRSHDEKIGPDKRPFGGGAGMSSGTEAGD